jgi:hypothetical protein
MSTLPQVNETLLRGALDRLPCSSEWRGVLITGIDPSGSFDAAWSDRALVTTVRHGRRRGGSPPGIIETAHRPASAFAISYATPSAWRHYALAAKPSELALVQLAGQIVESKHFGGADLCSGDAWLDRVANGIEDPTDPRAWQAAALSHHIAQLSRDVVVL